MNTLETYIIKNNLDLDEINVKLEGSYETHPLSLSSIYEQSQLLNQTFGETLDQAEELWQENETLEPDDPVNKYIYEIMRSITTHYQHTQTDISYHFLDLSSYHLNNPSLKSLEFFYKHERR